MRFLYGFMIAVNFGASTSFVVTILRFIFLVDNIVLSLEFILANDNFFLSITGEDWDWIGLC